MISTRRQFLRVALTGAAVLPFAGKTLASDLLASQPELALSDVALLDELERAAFEFFWNEANPATGLVLDRASANGGGSRGMATLPGPGFGLTALCIGYERSYRPRVQIEQRVAKTLQFLARNTPSEHGFFYHFVDAGTDRKSTRLNSSHT